MKSLVIAEKPSVGKDIARVLNCRGSGQGVMESDKYVVTWALGHLVTFADPEKYDKRYEKWDLNDLPIIPDELKLVVIDKTAKQFNIVKTQILRNDISEIIIATDAGREGELVARWILQKAGARKKLKRLWISSVTDKAIREGFQKLKDGKDYENLYKSAVARANSDWIVGINATRALTVKYNTPLSCGRVQTPTLYMIAKREDDIRKFTPKPYYGITAKVRGVSFTSQTFQTDCEELMKSMQGKTAEIISIEKTLKKQQPQLPYDLTQLQADANNMFGFSAKDTLSIIQDLYETHKVLTYPRTDSRYLTTDIVDTLPERVRACALPAYRKICSKLQSVKFSKNAFFINDQKVSDHHAIIPTEQSVVPDKLSDKEYKIYDLVVKRFLAMLCPPFEYEQTDLKLKIGNEVFKAHGKKVISMGYREVFAKSADDDDEDDQLLPDLKKYEAMKVDQLIKTTGKTKPPAPFNEASLLNAMENPVSFMDQSDKELIKTIGEVGGIGTVATRADIIEKLFSSFVIEKRGKDIFITPKGRQLLKLAPKDLTSPALTAVWEQRLSRISKGQEDHLPFLNEINKYTREIITQIKSSDATFRHDNITSERCPECGKFLLDVNGKKGKMLVCQDRECGFRKSVSFITNFRCPTCHKNLELVGDGEKRVYVCKCGFKEKYDSFQEKRKQDANKMSDKEASRYIASLNRSDEKNTPFADAFKKLNLK